jgi:hypothetical protein
MESLWGCLNHAALNGVWRCNLWWEPSVTDSEPHPLHRRQHGNAQNPSRLESSRSSSVDMRALTTQPFARLRLASTLRHSWWAVPALIAVASRVWGTGLVYAVGATSWRGFASPPAAGPATTWDGAWYLSIARHGYHATALVQTPRGGYHDFAFWPAWPALLAPLLRLVPEAWADVTAALTANTLAVVGLVLWARVLEPTFGRRDARYAIAFLGFAPPAFILSMAYSEPLFLLAAASFFLSRADSLKRPLLAALAQATRVTGFAVAASVLPALARARGRDLRAWLTLAAPLVVFAGWWLLIADLTGDPAGFLQGTPSWLYVTGQLAGPASFLPDLARDTRYELPILITAIFMVTILLATLRLLRRYPAFGCYCLAALLPTLLFASWQSMPRHALLAVPALAVAVQPLSGRWRWLLLALSAGAEVVMVNSMVGIRLISP